MSQSASNQRRYLEQYLKELSQLLGRTVLLEELGSPEEAQALRVAAQQLLYQPSVVREIGFDEKKTSRFRKFVERLVEVNPNPVYVFTPRTISCGVLEIDTLRDVRFDFDFGLNPEGILSFVTRNLSDSLLLDFFESPGGERRVEVEAQGASWARIEF
jgi:hypothetical protein